MLSLESVELLIIVLGLVRDMVPWSCNSMRGLHGTATSLTDSPAAVGLKEAANVKCFLLLVMVFAAVLLPSAIATTMVATQLKCALCNETSEQIVLESSNTLGGSSDLDGRPPEMLRSTMDAWAHECPSCGYCSYRLDERIEGAERAIKDPAYIEILRDESMDTLTRRFLCLSKIHDAARENNNALEYALYATWTLDDANDQARAVVIRKAVINKLEPLIKSGQRFRDQTAADQLLASDIARRVGDFAKASAYASAGLELKPDADIEKMLRYELALVAKSDTQVHTIAEAVESPEIGDQATKPREKSSTASVHNDDSSSGGEIKYEAANSLPAERMAQINARSAKLQAADEAFKKARVMRDNRDWGGARAQYQQIIQDNRGSIYAATAEKELTELVRQAQLDEVKKVKDEAEPDNESADDSAFTSKFSGVYIFTSRNDEFMRRTTLDLRSNSNLVFEELRDYSEQTRIAIAEALPQSSATADSAGPPQQKNGRVRVYEKKIISPDEARRLGIFGLQRYRLPRESPLQQQDRERKTGVVRRVWKWAPIQQPAMDTSNARRAAPWKIGYSGEGKWGRGENGKLTIAFILCSNDGGELRGLLSFDVEPNGDLLSLPESLKSSNGDAVEAARESVPEAFMDQVRLVKQQ